MLAGNNAISIFSWSPNKFYHSFLVFQIKQLVKAVINQKDKEQIVYEINSAKIKYISLAWVVGHLVGKGGIKGDRRNL